MHDYQLKCQQLESDLSSKDESIARMTGEIKELNDLLHMDPAQQMASLVIRKLAHYMLREIFFTFLNPCRLKWNLGQVKNRID